VTAIPAATAATDPAPVALRVSLARASALEPWYGGRVGPAPQGSVTVAALAADPGHIAALARAVAEAEGHARLDIAAGFVWSHVAYRAIAAPLVCAAVDGVAPVTTAQTVAMTFDAAGEPDDVTFTDRRMLTVHPVADRTAVRCTDRGALAGAVRGQILATLAPLVPVAAPLARRGERVLWLEVGDLVTSILGGVAEDLERPDARDFADAVLAGAPVLGSAAWTPFTHAGITCTHHVRSSCCRYWQVGPAPCGACPLRSADERAERFAMWNERIAADRRGDAAIAH
jgi:ferric iron reductase protein FhuF